MLFSFLNNFFAAFMLTGLFFSATRTIKYRRMQALRYLNIHDINVMTVSSLFFSGIATTATGFWLILPGICIVMLTFYLTIDAVVSMQYGYQLDWQTVKLAWEQRHAVLPENNKQNILTTYFSGQIYLLLLPVFTSFYLIGLIAKSHTILWYGFCIYFSVTLLVLTKSRLNKKTFLPWVIMIAVIFLLQSILVKHSDQWYQLKNIEYLMGIFIVLLVSLNILARFIDWPFFQISNLLAHLVLVAELKTNRKIQITAADRKIIDLDLAVLAPSILHGKLKKKNVILIYLESVSSCFLQNSITGLPNLPFFQKLLPQSVFSDYHVCITPNTNSSLLAMFSSQYTYTEEFHCLNIFKQNNYHTIFAAPSSLHGGTKKLVKAFGFEEIICQPEGAPIISDASFFQEKFTDIKAAIAKNENYFLVLHNQQTHIPYHIYGEKPKHNSFERYQQAMQQSEQAIVELIEQLGISLADTLIVYTGDHGQSFGQFGFTAHSNAVIKEQINVPLLFSHSALEPRTIAHSSHFDVLPTIMDLLGFNFNFPIVGRTLAGEKVAFSHLLFSETRRGKLPACFAHINIERKLFFDLNYQRFLWLTLQDEIIAPLTRTERKHYSEVMLQALLARGLVNRPFS